MAERLHLASKAHNCSVSKFVATLIDERLSGEDKENKRKLQMLRELRGSIDDPTFIEPPDILVETELSRRYDLI
jgi:hypothetical protein